MHFTNHNHYFDCFLLCLENYDDENHNIIVDSSLCLFCDHWMIGNFKIYISSRSKPKRYYVQQKALANIYITRAPWQCRLQYEPRQHCGHKLHKREFSEHPLQEETLLSWRKSVESVLSMRSQIWDLAPKPWNGLNSVPILTQGPKFPKKRSTAFTLCCNLHICGQCSRENLSQEYIASIRTIRILVTFACPGHFQKVWQKKRASSILAVQQNYIIDWSLKFWSPNPLLGIIPKNAIFFNAYRK